MINKFTTKVSINTKGEAIGFAKALVEVSDDFAVGFGQWLIKKEHEYTNKIIAMEYLLEIYKKERGL